MTPEMKEMLEETAALTMALAKKNYSPGAVAALREAVDVLPPDVLQGQLNNTTALCRSLHSIPHSAETQPPAAPNPPASEATPPSAAPSTQPTKPSGKQPAQPAATGEATTSAAPAKPPPRVKRAQQGAAGQPASDSKKQKQQQVLEAESEEEEDEERDRNWNPAGSHPHQPEAGVERVALPPFDATEKWSFPDLPDAQKTALKGWAGLANQFGMGHEQLKSMGKEICKYNAGGGLFTPEIVQRIIDAPEADQYLYEGEPQTAFAELARKEAPLTVEHAEQAAQAYHDEHILGKEKIRKGRQFHHGFFGWYTASRKHLWPSRHEWGPPTMALWVWHNVFSREIKRLRASS